jgi:hypothetical protein
MPFKFEYIKKKIPKGLDRRIKLSTEQREEIKKLYGKISQRKLANLFGVSRRLIQFIGCPEKLAHAKKINKLNAALNDNYYNREKHNAAMKKYRMYKQELMKKGKLK